MINPLDILTVWPPFAHTPTSGGGPSRVAEADTSVGRVGEVDGAGVGRVSESDASGIPRVAT